MKKNKSKKKSVTQDNMFFLNFIGEYVEVLGRASMPTVDGNSMPLTLQGYLLDMDDDYYYFGENPGEFTSVIKKSDVAYISIVEKKDAATLLLEQIPEPKDEKEFN